MTLCWVSALIGNTSPITEERLVAKAFADALAR